MSVLTCPVCQGSMRELNKSGVLIDSCTQCRGVWLDRGELEKLSQMVGAPPAQQTGFLPAAPAQDYRPDPRRGRDDDDDDDDDRRNRRHGGYDQSNMPRKKSSFLDFFD